MSNIVGVTILFTGDVFIVCWVCYLAWGLVVKR